LINNAYQGEVLLCKVKFFSRDKFFALRKVKFAYRQVKAVINNSNNFYEVKTSLQHSCNFTGVANFTVAKPQLHFSI
jgi:hypothetical protein